MYDDAPLRQIALGIEKLVRTVIGLASDRAPRPDPPTTVPGALPVRAPRGASTGRA